MTEDDLAKCCDLIMMETDIPGVIRALVCRKCGMLKIQTMVVAESRTLTFEIGKDDFPERFAEAFKVATSRKV